MLMNCVFIIYFRACTGDNEHKKITFSAMYFNISFPPSTNLYSLNLKKDGCDIRL